MDATTRGVVTSAVAVAVCSTCRNTMLVFVSRISFSSSTIVDFHELFECDDSMTFVYMKAHPMVRVPVGDFSG